MSDAAAADAAADAEVLAAVASENASLAAEEATAAAAQAAVRAAKAAAEADAAELAAQDAERKLSEAVAAVERAGGDDAAEGTATGDADEKEGNPNKKRKVALVFGYVGKGYNGMQRNPGVRTIEDEMESAIHAAGGISDSNKGDFSKVHWMRAARTDKGVSAVGQVISLNMIVEPPGIVERINAALPDTFKVFGMRRVTTGFNAKNMCDRRRRVKPPCCHAPCALQFNGAAARCRGTLRL